MKKILLSLSFVFVGLAVLAQPYAYKVYNGVPAYGGVSAGVAYSVPDAIVTGTGSLTGVQLIGMDCRNFDQVATPPTVSDFTQDYNATCGLNEGSGTDVAGTMIRGWSFDIATNTQYAPLTWNAAPQAFRKGGGWYFYTVNFSQAGTYTMFLRVRGSTPGTGTHVYTVTFYSKTNMGAPLATLTADFAGMDFTTIGSSSTDGNAIYAADANTGATGQAGSEWVRFTTTVNASTAGEMVVKISQAGTTANSSMGAFTFIKDFSTSMESPTVAQAKVWLSGNNRLHIENVGTSKVSLVNMVGVPVEEFVISGSTDRELGLKQGVYLVKVQSKNGLVKTQKVLVK